jgi:manganese/iron transport system substrate-binding protein
MLGKTKISSIFTVFMIYAVSAVQCGTPTSVALPSDEAVAEIEQQYEYDLETAYDDLAPFSPDPGQQLQVVATTSIVGDLVRNVDDDLIDLAVMLPPGSDPHTFQPAPRDAALVADAHVVFINGLDLEEFLAELIDNAGGEATVIPVSAGIETRQFGDGREHDDDTGHQHRGADPHVWMSPANAIVMVNNVEQALSTLDPANAEAYEARAKAYEAQLAELDEWVKKQIETIPAENREMVTDHDAFGYYAERYGLEIVGTVIPAYSTNAEPSAQELAELEDAIGEYGVKAVFVGTMVNPVLSQQVAEDLGIQLIPLYTGSLGEPGSDAETYIDFIHYNTTAIVDALR